MNERGGLFIIILFLLMILGFIGGIVAQWSDIQINSAVRRNNAMQSYFLADSAKKMAYYIGEHENILDYPSDSCFVWDKHAVNSGNPSDYCDTYFYDGALLPVWMFVMLEGVYDYDDNNTEDNETASDNTTSDTDNSTDGESDNNTDDSIATPNATPNEVENVDESGSGNGAIFCKVKDGKAYIYSAWGVSKYEGMTKVAGRSPDNDDLESMLDSLCNNGGGS